MIFDLLHLHEIVGITFSLQFVCVSVCLWMCLTLLVNKITAKRMNRFGRDFRKMVSFRTGSNPIEIGGLGSKGQGHSDVIPIFLS